MDPLSLEEYIQPFGYDCQKGAQQVLHYWDKPLAIEHSLSALGHRVHGFHQLIELSPAALTQHLPYSGGYFELALVHGAVFAHRTLEFDIALIQELGRVAQEIRIYPILDSTGNIPHYLPRFLEVLQDAQYGIQLSEIPKVKHPANVLLQLWPNACVLANE
ncbi:MAG TPA: hypothetical protein VJB02_00550 [Coxiellaceae bacterium]|nr:hypothetical protein [Coxiellaceae bacterium]